MLIMLGSSIWAVTPPVLACQNHRSLIDGVKLGLERELDLKEGTPVEVPMITNYLRSAMPQCPAGGTYIIGKIGEPATCSLAAHADSEIPAFLAAYQAERNAKREELSQKLWTRLALILLAVPVIAVAVHKTYNKIMK